MNRGVKSVLWIVSSTAIVSGVFAFSDYYNAAFKMNERSQRTVQRDSAASIKERALLGAACGLVVGVYMAVRGWRRDKDPWDK